MKSNKNIKNRVSIVLPYFGSGGAEAMVSRLASHLDTSKVDAEVVCIYGEPQNNLLEKRISENNIKLRYIRKGKGFSFKAMCKLFAELSRFNPDVVHTHLSACVYCVPWVLLHRVKMLHTIHSVPKYELIKPKKIIMSFMYKIGKAIPIAISTEIKELLKDEYRITMGPEVIYNPVDIECFALPKIKHDGFNIITAGRLSKEKNQKMIIDAIEILRKKYSDIKLTILGDGLLRKELEQYVREKNMNNIIQFKGRVDNVEEYFAESDIFVLSSTYEGLPLVILEAMAAGLPVIATNVGGVKDIVTDNGILVESNNVQELVVAIEELFSNQTKRDCLENNARNNVKGFDSNIIAEQYIDLYKKYSTV